jgi:hypothetical protein
VVSFRYLGRMLALAVLALAGACAGDGNEPHRVFGVNLGLSATQTRAAFEPPVAGAWTTVTEPTLTLIWTPSDRSRSGAVRGPVTFEFHEGRLVAIRALLAADAPLATGNPLSLRAVSLLVRERAAGDKVSLRVLARDCPTHAREVRAVLTHTRRPQH